jgi:4-diphosphocytidyl-2-C-methyl-D-erythritol kinase
MRETAYAKINVELKVLGRRPDGYHELETVFAFAEDGDLIEADEAGALTLEVTGPFAADVPAGSDNLVLRAASMLAEGRGAAIRLDKRLPVASGIGGGSADAAAALRLLNRLWRLERPDDALAEIAGALGADVPACLYSRPARGVGRGDLLTALDLGLAGTLALLVNPGVPLSTAHVFRAWDGAPASANDLEPAARRLVPEIGDVLDALAAAPRSGMSGSGATCFALFGDEASRDALAARLPEAWWRLPTRLR